MSYFATKNVLFRHRFPVLFLLPRFIYKLDFGGEFEFLIKVNRKENYEKQCNDENCQNDSNPDFFLCCRPLKKRFNFG